MKRPLFLNQIVDHLFAVLPVGAIADVYPIGASPRVLLPNQLVKLAMGLDPFEPPLALRQIPVDAQVSRFSSHVLAVRYTTDGHIQGQRPKS